MTRLTPVIDVSAYLRMTEKEYTVPEVLGLTEALVEEHEADKFLREERYAIQHEHVDDSTEATTRRAIEALQQPDTPWGKHAVAKAWLRDYAPTVGIFRREAP